MQISNEIRRTITIALQVMQTHGKLGDTEMLEKANDAIAWLDSQPQGEWTPVEEEVKYTIGDRIEVRVGPHSVSARWKGHGGGSFSFPDHLSFCRRTTQAPQALPEHHCMTVRAMAETLLSLGLDDEDARDVYHLLAYLDGKEYAPEANSE